MSKVPRIMPVTDLRKDAASVLKTLQASGEPFIITQRGRAAAILISVDTYERSERERELLRLLALGEKEIASGKGYSLDKVLKETDALFREE